MSNKNEIEKSSEYAALAAEVLQEQEDVHWILSAGLRIDYLTSMQEKKKSGREVLGECMLVKDPYPAYCDADFLIVIYAPNVSHLSRDQKKILLYHELLHVETEDQDGEMVCKIRPHDVEDFRRIIDRYGLDWSREGGG